MRTLILGDVHGALRAVKQVFERASFDPKEDRLIFLGDAVDGWSESKEVLDLFTDLLKYEQHVFLLGNHDAWLYCWLRDKVMDPYWPPQGGLETLASLVGVDMGNAWAGISQFSSVEMNEEARVLVHRASGMVDELREEYVEYFRNTRLYFEEGNKLFVHAGIQPKIPLEKQSDNEFLWSRGLYHKCRGLSTKENHSITGYDEVYIGHSTTEKYSLEPLQCCEVWLLDQGAGWGGKLTLMDAESKEYWQSDVVSTLYPGELGRRR